MISITEWLVVIAETLGFFTIIVLNIQCKISAAQFGFSMCCLFTVAFVTSIMFHWYVTATLDAINMYLFFKTWWDNRKKRKLLQKVGYKAKALIAKMKSSSAFKSGRPAIPVSA